MTSSVAWRWRHPAWAPGSWNYQTERPIDPDPQLIIEPLCAAPQFEVQSDYAELLEILDEEGREGHGCCEVAAKAIRSLSVAPAAPKPPCEDYCGNRGCEIFGCALSSPV